MNTLPMSSHDPRGWWSCILPTLGTSPLYTSFAEGLQQDGELQQLLALVDPDQPTLILFFSVVNFLLFEECQDQLATFYPVLTPSPRPPQGAYPVFRHFCLRHENELRTLLPQARLQTNEVVRCANLFPAFLLCDALGGFQPLSFIELGCSAGFNLFWDQYGYRYMDETGSTVVRGNPLASSIQVSCRVKGHLPTHPHGNVPLVQSRIGIERFPLDLTREGDQRWLRACIWPEEMERYQRLDAALAFAQRNPPPVLSGEAAELLPHLLPTLPEATTVCIYHSFALNQGPQAIREHIEQILCEGSRQRELFRLSLEVQPPNRPLPSLELKTYRAGRCIRSFRLATCALHGEWMHWRGLRKEEAAHD